MAPKKAAKLHQLAPEVKVGFKISDIQKKTFIVGKQFATGGFGRIHTCTEEGKSLQMVMKIEPSTNGPLLTEVVVFNRILKQEHLEAYKKKRKLTWIGLPWIIANGYFSYNNEKMRYMIIPKYAMSLEGAREANGGSLGVKESFTVANCVLGALEYLHDVDYTHADVKAANILLEKEGVYSSAVLVDFGLAHRTTNNIDKPDKKRAHNGTCIFTSTDAHRGNNPSFRGDIEILGYNLVMWLTGTLPWMALEASPDKVFEAKQKFVSGLPGTLQNVLKPSTSSAGVVQCITGMFKMAQETGYTQKVDMDKLRKLVAAAITSAKSSASSSASTSARTPAKNSKTPAKSTKKKPIVESDEEEDRELTPPPKKKTSRKEPSRRRQPSEEPGEPEEVVVKKKTTSRRRAEPEVVEDDEEVVIPRSTRTRRRLQEDSEDVSKNAEQKKKVIATRKSSTRSPEPTTSSRSSRSPSVRRAGGAEAQQLKTPVATVKKAKYTSGISSATKASPTELRRVPGVRNFPVGRRSMIIKEKSAHYKQKQSAAASAAPAHTFEDDGSSSSEI